jgi:predicted nucleic acid-binding protein
VSVPKLVVHTDIILDHLYGRHQPSVLRVVMGQSFCYTTVFNAIELFARSRNEHERKLIEDSLSGMKILGLNPKNALRFAGLVRRHRRKRTLDLLVAGLCLESKLPLLTSNAGAFRGITGLHFVSPREVLSRFERSVTE